MAAPTREETHRPYRLVDQLVIVITPGIARDSPSLCRDETGLAAPKVAAATEGGGPRLLGNQFSPKTMIERASGKICADHSAFLPHSPCNSFRHVLRHAANSETHVRGGRSCDTQRKTNCAQRSSRCFSSKREMSRCL